MADGTGIAWTNATWSPITGCSVVSPGCTNCYAMRLAGTRMKNEPSRKGLTRDTKAGPIWTGEVRFNERWLDQPLRWRRPRLVFVCAHADLFHENVPEEWIDRVFAVMSISPQHVFQILTKRPHRMRAYIAADRMGYIEGRAKRMMRERSRAPDKPVAVGRTLAGTWPWPHVWLGTSVEDQQRADERIPILLDTPAAVRWISAEPLLGPVDLTRLADKDGAFIDAREGTRIRLIGSERPGFHLPCPRLDWVVIGGESGPGARTFTLGWGKDLIRQCQAAGLAVFMKQVGSVPVNREGERCPHIRDPKGGDPAEWPEELRVQEWPR